MISSLKFILSFCLSFLILCIPAGDRPLFLHIYEKASPSANRYYREVKEETLNRLGQGKEIGKKLIMNANPDYVGKTAKKIKKDTTEEFDNLSQAVKEETLKDKYTAEEEAMLSKILANENK